ncbi:MAG: hypothetical protein QXS54_02085 [Candidatus Methanomethylicaceae archaeon]
MLTPSQFRTLLNVAHDVPDAVLEQHIKAAKLSLEAVARQPLYPRQIKEWRGVTHAGGLQHLIVGYNPRELVELKVSGRTLDASEIQQVSTGYTFSAEELEEVYVKLLVGYDSPLPEDLVYTCALLALIYLQEAGYARTESWAGLEQIGISSPEGSRTLRRGNIMALVRERISQYVVSGTICLL